MNRSTNLVDQLSQQAKNNPKAFPGQGNIDYAARFTALTDRLNKEIHSEVEKAALLRDAQEIRQVMEGHFSGDIEEEQEELKKWTEEGIPALVYLNDHGPEHIRMVIRRASDLLSFMECRLIPYEIYILLVSIHFHDVGNLYGRYGHETQISKVIYHSDFISFFGDSAEQKIIKRIAAAHGGKIGEDRDTIGKLPAEPEFVLSYGIRMQYLAAILRLSDELADDSSRASRFIMSEGLLQGSEIYHRYSNSLKSVKVKEKLIELKFELNKTDIVQLYAKGLDHAYLIDEIFERTLKMHFETVYCMRYIRSAPHPSYENMVDSEWKSSVKTIETIKVTIEIFKDFKDDEPFKRIQYALQEKGYPKYSSSDIHIICPEINQQFSSQLGKFNEVKGELLKQLIEEQIGETNNE